VKRNRRGLRLFVVASIAAFAASGCSTVIQTAAPDDQAHVASHMALEEAAASVAASPWPKPASSSLADRLAGASSGGEKISRDDAVDAYAVKLLASGRGDTGLLADAARHLEAAGALNAVAQTVCDSPAPRLSDVALLEDAIADLRQTRSIYVSALKQINGDKNDVDHLKRDFDKAIKDLGSVADDLAKNAMKQRTSNFAAPASASQLTGAF
jgi:hypothetical protein